MSIASFLNVNTMGAPIIQMLNNELTLEAAESIVIFRDSEEGFDTLEEFLQTPQLAGLSIPRELLSVKSSFSNNDFKSLKINSRSEKLRSSFFSLRS